MIENNINYGISNLIKLRKKYFNNNCILKIFKIFNNNNNIVTQKTSNI